MKKFFSVLAVIILSLVAISVWYVSPIYSSMNDTDAPIGVYVDADDTQDSIYIRGFFARGRARGSRNL